MAAILLDVDGVLHVSGKPIPGAPEAVRQLRRAGHRLRFVTNNTTRPRAVLADELRGCGIEVEDTGRVFSYMNLARAFGELELGAELYCLHKNRWWQTSRGPLLDSGAFVAGLEFAAGVEATVLGKPSPAYFEAALEALDAEPELTWMVGDDLDSDVAGAQRYGLKTVLVRTGKFRPDELNRSMVVPDAVISSVAYLPEWLERSL
jgi:ribonucleotide monophosphatase NagD (HAD superfamily)